LLSRKEKKKGYIANFNEDWNRLIGSSNFAEELNNYTTGGISDTTPPVPQFAIGNDLCTKPALLMFGTYRRNIQLNVTFYVFVFQAACQKRFVCMLFPI